MGSSPVFVAGRLRPGTTAKIAYLAFIAVALVLTLYWLHQALPRYLPKEWSQAHDYDGLIDWKAARYWLAGKSPYLPEGLAEFNVIGIGHPPTTGFWFIPLARFDKAIAAEIVGLTTWLFLLIHLYVCLRELDYPAPLAVTGMLFAWILTTGGMVMHWHAIQLSEQIALPIVIAWLYLRRGREIPAGIALGLAGTIKPFPGLIIVMLLFARRFRAFFAAGITFAVVAAVMTSVYGFESWGLFLHQQTLISVDWLGSVRNASLQGIVLRLFAPICWSQGTQEALQQHLYAPQARAAYLAATLGLALFLGSWHLSRRSFRQAAIKDPRHIDLPFALFAALSVFLSPWIWEHYHVLAILPVIIVVAHVSRRFGHALRDWLDEHTRHRVLVREAVFAAIVATGLGAVVWIFSLNIGTKEQMLQLWRATHDEFYHRQLHIYEIYSWLPWVILIAVAALSAWYLAPRRETSSR